MNSLEKLIKIYQEAQQKLVQIISTKEAKGTVTSYQKGLLKQINDILQQLDKQSKDLSLEIVTEDYKKTFEEVNKILKNMGQSIDNSFSLLHTQAIKIIANNMYNKLNEAHNFVGRNIQDAVREVGLKAISQKLSVGETVKECKKSLVNALIQEGINGIKDKRGRMISLDAYADIVARSTSAEATNTATTNRMEELGNDLVKMTSHSPTCSICAIYQGRVYSISGKDTRFPPLSRAFGGEYANIHPRCRHRIFPYIESLADDFEGDLKKSNEAFELSEKDKKAIEQYNKQQSEKTKLRNDRNQWQRYSLLLPSDTPKNLGAFRKMKQSNSDRWQELESTYRSEMIKQSKAQ